jgi:hypothetical protein
VPSYLVELYLPRSRALDVGVAASRARAAVDELSQEGIPIRYIRTTFLPDDETCFHLFDADSVTAVDAVCVRARFGRVRIVPAIEEVEIEGAAERPA